VRSIKGVSPQPAKETESKINGGRGEKGNCIKKTNLSYSKSADACMQWLQTSYVRVELTASCMEMRSFPVRGGEKSGAKTHWRTIPAVGFTPKSKKGKMPKGEKRRKTKSRERGGERLHKATLYKKSCPQKPAEEVLAGSPRGGGW